MASARSLSLMEQRNPQLKRRVLSPQNNSVSSIAKKTVLKETEIMIQRYNDGLVGNQEMLSFLETAKANPGIRPEDVEDLDNQIRDFQLRIAKDNLEARYKNTAEGSAERLIAGQQLAAFYNQRAQTLEAGTPAQSQALENAGVWQQRVQADSQAIQKRARSIERARMEQEVNMVPSNTSENAMRKVEMYQALYDQALRDGDELSAQRFLAQANYEQTRSVDVAQREEEQAAKAFQTASRKELVDGLNMLADAYHDGEIDENSYLQTLATIEPRINELGDTALALTFNRTVDTVQKNLEKGGLRRVTTSSGLPAVIGKGPAGGQSTDWDVQDYNHSDNLRVLQEALQSGDIDPQQYQENLAEIMGQRQSQIEERLTTIDQLAQENPNTKITYEGRKQRVGDLLESLYKEQTSFQNEYGAVMSGKGQIFVIPPDQMNQSGSVKKSGKSYATYAFIDPETLTDEQRMQYAQDDTGIFHPVSREKKFVDLKTLDPSTVDMNYNTITNPDGTQSKFFYDSSGNPYMYGGQKVNYYKPGSTSAESIPYEPGQVLSVRGLQPAVVQDQNGEKFKNPIAPENLDVNAVRASIPSPKQFEQAIQAPKPVNLDPMNLPQGLTTDLSKMSQPSAIKQEPIKMPEIKPVQPLNISQTLPAGLTQVSKPQNLTQPKVSNLSTAIQPVVQKVSNVLKQSPFDFLKKKLGF